MSEYFDFWKFLAGLGIFLIGMYFIEETLKNLAGRSFKKILRKFTNTPIRGIIGGTVSTAILQSSSVVSLMVLAFVGAGILQLKNAIGIIFGANLGTTFTGWLVTALGFKVDIEGYALPFIAIGSIFFIFVKSSKKLNEIGKLIFGFGFLFLGLSYMKISVDAFANQFDLSSFANLSFYIFLVVGLVLTAIIQSSSAAMVITLSALNANLIPLEAAAATVIGSDLGTTITVMFGALNGTPSKKRVALSHLLLNVVTAVLAIAVLIPLLYFITKILRIEDALYALVAFHSMFNLLGILLMFPFIKPFARFLEGRFSKNEDVIANYIDKVDVDVPEAAMEALKNETNRLLGLVFIANVERLNIGKELFEFKADENRKFESRFDTHQKRYEFIKELEGEILEYILKLESEKLEREESSDLGQVLHQLKDSMIALKAIKDISHNVKDFEKSVNDTKQELFKLLRNQVHQYYLNLYEVFHSKEPSVYFEKLVVLISDGQNIHSQFLKALNKQIKIGTVNDIEISTLMNVNRQIHYSNKNLLNAVKYALLDSGQAENLNAIPDMEQNS